MISKSKRISKSRISKSRISKSRKPFGRGNVANTKKPVLVLGTQPPLTRIVIVIYVDVSQMKVQILIRT